MRIAALFTALALLAAAPDRPKERVLRHSAVLDAPVEKVWQAFTTREGLESLLGVKARMERFAVGASYQTNYNREAGPDDPGWITHHILSFEPEVMISGRFTAPANAPVAKVAEAVWTVTRFEALDPTRTRLTVTMCGWQSGPEWDKAYAFFERGNAWTLEQIKKKFSAEAPKADPWPRLRSLIGGAWVGDRVEDGAVSFRVVNRGAAGPGDRTLVFTGRMGPPDKLRYHAQVQVWRGEDGRVRLHCIDEEGRAFTGRITARSADHLIWSWQQVDGAQRFDTEMRFLDEHRYRFEYFKLTDGERESAMTAVFKRRRQRSAY